MNYTYNSAILCTGTVIHIFRHSPHCVKHSGCLDCVTAITVSNSLNGVGHCELCWTVLDTADCAGHCELSIACVSLFCCRTIISVAVN